MMWHELQNCGLALTCQRLVSTPPPTTAAIARTIQTARQR